jgi:hypothetical protein
MSINIQAIIIAAKMKIFVDLRVLTRYTPCVGCKSLM